jgi:sucrose phosphorylase
VDLELRQSRRALRAARHPPLLRPQGARIIRLDAIAYLWKKPGTPCIHLPETHEVVKLLRAFVDMVAPDVVLITETNVPHAENVSYFGAGDEAHMVYQFALPPLLLHALLTGDAERLTALGRRAGPPARRLHLPQFHRLPRRHRRAPAARAGPRRGTLQLARHVEEQGGRVSMKKNADGSESPYELNITYFDALGGGPNPGSAITRFPVLADRHDGPAGRAGPLLSKPGGRAQRPAGVHRTGSARSINRHKWQELLRRLRLRADQAAFDPASPQQIHALHPQVFTVERGQDASRLLALHHLCDTTVEVALDTRSGPWRDLLDPSASALVGPTVTLGPYACRWLVPAL